MGSSRFHFECNESRSKKQPSDDENCFVEACKRCRINPWKDRYFRKPICILTGYSPDTFTDWSENRYNSPFPLFKDANNRTFAFRHDLISYLDKYKRVGINSKEMAQEILP